MTSRIAHTTVDARNAHDQSHWWGEVLGWAQDPEDPNLPGHEECMIFSPDGRQRVLFIEVPEAKSVKNRLHIDVTASGGRDVPIEARRERVDAEVERLVALGATRVRLVSEEGMDHYAVAMLDPEGNEFDIN